MSEKNKSNKIEITRVYDAPVKAVWEAWTDPKQAAHWWGPRGFTITTHSKDFRAGGSWKYTMHGPDGTNYPNDTKYLEVEQYKRLVYDHGGNDDQPPMFRVTVNFSENKGKTKMEMSMALKTPEEAAQTREIIKKANGNSTWDRLAEYLAKEQEGKEEFFINRSFDCSVETMYEMWANPKHLSKWLGPTGSTMEFIRADIKPGGSSFYSMSMDGTNKMYGKIKYVEMTKPNRLVYSQQFCDQNEKVTRHPMMATWPETMLTTIQFAEEGPTQTRVTVKWEIQGTASREEMETFIKMKGGMTQGWTGSFNKLEEYVSKL